MMEYAVPYRRIADKSWREEEGTQGNLKSLLPLKEGSIYPLPTQRRSQGYKGTLFLSPFPQYEKDS
jgi:hypothetical protein